MDRAFPNLAALYRKYIPVSSVQAECSFSRLNILEIYLRLTMCKVACPWLGLT
uniref:HAT C-terminal dimerisation domain-containing protein n=1 Tax=Anguilla anguilla TaxID=7936 RepID=A0A0E9V515_ANGAN